MFFFWIYFFVLAHLVAINLIKNHRLYQDLARHMIRRELLTTGKMFFPLSLRVKYFGISPFCTFNFYIDYFQPWSFRQFQRSPKK